MLPTQTIYPQFEANQVLTKSHLNQLFNFLDEQNRLTRTNLIGIGIVCGLEVETAADGQSLTISHGCGITSQGYLVSMEDFTATHAEVYTVPEEVAYPVLYDNATQSNRFDLWELTDNGANGGSPLNAGFLSDKIVMVFVELLEEQLRNCSPNSCDDKGAEVVMSFKPLLIRKTDADTILAEVAALTGAGNNTDINNLITAYLALEEMRMPRVSVPYSAMISTADLVNSYRSILNRTFIEGQLRSNLLAAFDAFQILNNGLDRNIISNWAAPFAADDQVSFTDPHNYQYYYDFISDLMETYREIRLKGIDTLSLCCPNPDLFPRHLFLKEAEVGAVHERKYRHYFIPSPIHDHHQELAVEVRQLFERLIAQIQQAQFPVNVVSLQIQGRFDASIKITPSKLGPYPLSDKAIPYYYDVVSGSPALYELWNHALSKAGKANHNLSYHSDQYPGLTPSFITQPLLYDLEPYNFLRIEGHVGKNYQSVLSTLTYLKRNGRLAFDFVGIKTGSSPVTSILEQNFECHFQDLEAIYRTNMEELCCLLCKVILHFYDIEVFGQRGDETTPTNIPELLTCDENLTYTAGTFGFIFEAIYPQLKAQNFSFFANSNFSEFSYAPYFFIFYLIELKGLMEDTLSGFITNSQETFNEYYTYVELLGNALRALAPDDAQGPNFVQTEDLIDHIDAVLLACKKDVFDAITDEYNRRILNIQEQFLLGNYTRQHPGINHKAGVPIGGTFLVVYHGDDDPQRPITRPRSGRAFVSGFVTNEVGEPLIGVNVVNRQRGSSTLTDFDGRFEMVVTTLPSRLDISYTGYRSTRVWVTQAQQSFDIILQTGSAGNDLEDGIVIADFYLPYLCCSDCPPVQFVLSQPTIAPLNVVQDNPICSTDGTTFTVRCTVSGGTPPYQRDGVDIMGNFFEVILPSGTEGSVVVTDSTGEPFTVLIAEHVCDTPDPLVATPSDPICSPNNDTFTVTCVISGGTPPYTQDGIPVNGTSFQKNFPSGIGGTVDIVDSNGQSFPLVIQPHTCQTIELLSATFTTPICSPNNDEFSVTCTVSGGTAPYTQDGTPVSGSSFMKTYPSGDSGTIMITDSTGQNYPLAIPAHTCTQPCDLPCNGEFMTCRYIPWLTKPKDGQGNKINFVEIAQLSIIDERGVQIYDENLVPLFQNVVANAGELVSPGNYDALMTEFVNEVNNNISEKLGNNDSFFLKYVPDEGLIQFGYYACYQFNFEILIGIASSAGVFLEATHRYTTSGVSILYPNQAAPNIIPKFGCDIEFRCSGDPTQFNCRSEAIFELKISPGSSLASLELSNPSGIGIKEIYWLLDFARPPFFENTTTIESTIAGGYSPVSVLIIDSNDCWAFICDEVRTQQFDGNSGVITTPTTVDPLTVSAGNPVCAPNNESFRVDVSVSGGIPPYQHDQGDINGNTFSRSFPNGGSGTITVTDAEGTSASAAVSGHKCTGNTETPNDCKLPCDGIYVNCRFLPWIHKPKTAKQKYQYTTAEESKLILTNDKGEEILNEDLGQIIKKEINKVRTSITPGNYDRVMDNIAKAIMKFLADKLGTPPIFRIAYNKEEGVLQISHFACYTFDWKIAVKLAKDDKEFANLNYNYTQEGVSISSKGSSKKSSIKKFGCDVANLCNNKIVSQSCRSAIMYELNSKWEGKFLDLSLSISGEGGVKEVYWIVGNSTPFTGQGKKFRTAPKADSGPISVIIIDDKGCWAFFSDVYTKE